MFSRKHIITAACAVMLAAPGAVLAKGHDQGGTAQPGSNTKTETVCPAMTLGGALGGGVGSQGKSAVNCS